MGALFDFDPEDKIIWESLSPSLQKRFKDLEDRIKEALETIDFINGATFKSWNLKMWETHHIFTDLSFYETMRVTQSGVNNKITSKTYNNIYGDLYQYPTLSSQAMWIKHQFVWTGPDGVTRIYLGGRDASGRSAMWRSDATGLQFTKVATFSKHAVWDICSFKNRLFVLDCYDPSYLWVSNDGLNFSMVNISIHGTYIKTICEFKGVLYIIGIGTTYYSSDGVNWSSKSNNLSGIAQIYSRYTTTDSLYIGTVDFQAVYKSTDAFNFSLIPGSNQNSNYTRWITAWTPKNNADHPGQTVEYILWGTGGTGTEIGTAQLWMYDPIDNASYCLFDFRGDRAYNTAHSEVLNYGHAPLEPLIPDSTSPTGYKTAGFRERQIRYIEVYENDYTGESFLVIGTSDCHFTVELQNTTLYYGECDFTNNTVTPLKDSNGNLLDPWSASDKEAWVGDNIQDISDVSKPTYMGNVYVVGPRNPKSFKKNDLAIALIKHTEDTRIYSMSNFTDPDGIKWVYVGTGGGNFNGKGLLYRFGYSDMLDILEAAKIGAILPPRWVVEGIVNPKLRQDGSRFYFKIMSGASAREDYTEFRFAFKNTFIKSTINEPYVRLLANHYDSANNYEMKFYPLRNYLECIVKLNNEEKIVYTKNLSSLTLYNTSESIESSDSPRMGPFYCMAIKVNRGALNPESTTSFDKYLYDSMDGSVNFLFNIINSRDALLVDSDIIYTYNINYDDGERKNIGIYGIETFDCPGMYLISMKQMSLDKYEFDSKNQSLEGSGEIVFELN